MRDDPLDVDLDKSATEEPPGIGPQRARVLGLIGVVAVLVLALVLAYLYVRRPASSPAPAASAAATEPKPPSTSSAEPGEQIELPPLDQTDALVRQLIGQLSSHPTVAAWLTTDGLILNFALVTQRISNGESPASDLGPTGPVPAFRVRTSRGDLFIDPASYRRYDRYAQAVSSVDARGAARLYATLKPRILEASQRLERPARDFDPVLHRAIVELLQVPVVHGEVELAPHGIGYAFVDARLERLSAAQKHLLRMGPENVQTIQAKLREIADYLGIPVATLPRPPALTLDQ